MALVKEAKFETPAESKYFDVRQYPDDMLKMVAIPWVRAVADASFQELLDGLENTMQAYRALGISGPQVGIPYRVICIHTSSGPLTMVNPVIKAVSGDAEAGTEGCLSFPGLNLKVKRQPIIEVGYTERGGETKSAWFRGAEARAIQHEVDHLDGVVFIDRIPKVLRSDAMRKWKLAPRVAKKNEKQLKALLKRMAVQAKKDAEKPAALPDFGPGEVRKVEAGGVLTPEVIEAAAERIMNNAGT